MPQTWINQCVGNQSSIKLFHWLAHYKSSSSNKTCRVAACRESFNNACCLSLPAVNKFRVALCTDHFRFVFNHPLNLCKSNKRNVVPSIHFVQIIQMHSSNLEIMVVIWLCTVQWCMLLNSKCNVYSNRYILVFQSTARPGIVFREFRNSFGLHYTRVKFNYQSAWINSHGEAKNATVG